MTASETEGTPEQRSWEGNGLRMLRRRNNISKTKGIGNHYGYSFKKKKNLGVKLPYDPGILLLGI